jgi:hypothetical protein
MSKLRCHLSVGLEPDCGEYFAELTKFGVSAVFTVVSFQLVFLSPPIKRAVIYSFPSIYSPILSLFARTILKVIFPSPRCRPKETI